MIELKISGDTWEDFHRDAACFSQNFLHLGVQMPNEATQEKDDEPETPARPVRPGARRYGESEKSKARRTKEQIAEDKEIDELCAALGVTDKPDIPAAELLLQLREQSATAEPEDTPEPEAEAKPNISASPEDRKEPEPVSGEILDDKPEFTAEDVKAALSKVVEKKGMAEAISWLNKISGATKFSAIPQDKYAEIVAAADLV